MKRSLIRLISFILLVLMTVSLVACADNVPGETPGTTAAGAESDPSASNDESTAINAENILGPRDFGGETLTFYSRKYDGAWSSDLLVEEEDGTVLNDAIYKRNARLT